MYKQEIITFILFRLMSISAYGFNKASFIDLPGYRLNSNRIERFFVANKIQCVRACKRNPLCTSVNFKPIGNTMDCELNSESSNRTEHLSENASSTFSCKLFWYNCNTKKNRRTCVFNAYSSCYFCSIGIIYSYIFITWDSIHCLNCNIF